MSIPARIIADIRARLADGSLHPGDRLESTRVIARQQGVSRGSVVAAYEQLMGEGFLIADQSGTRVNPDLPQRSRPAPQKPSPEPAPPTLLRPGVPDTSLLTTHAWRAAWRVAAAEPTAYPAPGSPRLRRLIAEHVRITRQVVVSPDNVIITAGARDGLRTILQATQGAVAVDDPGFPSLHSIPLSLGRQVIPIRGDEHGMSLKGLAQHSPGVVLVMPNHLYPTGTQMPASRRLELIDWARRTGAVLVEDDYDSELRPAHPALAALDEQAVLLGSFAKTLTPALGLGYVIVPDVLRGVSATPVSGVVQDAMAEFMAADGLRRHIATMRRVYRRRRALVAEVFPQAVPMDGGLHAVLELAAEPEAVGKARAAGFGVTGLSQYWAGAGRSGVVLGVGGLDDARLYDALVTLRQLLAEYLVT